MSPRSLVRSLPKRLRKQASPVFRKVLHIEFLEDRCLLSTWFPIGPAPILNGNVPGNQPLAGRITGIAADPTDPKTIYIGSAGGGVWKTTDAGASWTPLTDNQPTLVMGAMAVAPSDPNVIYAGTGEPDGTSVNFLANYSPTTFYGRGVLKSTDAGKTWTLLGNDVFDRRSIAKVVVDPKDADVAYVAVGQPGFNGLVGNQGIWQTTDGGKSWTNTTAASGISDTLAFSDLVMDPSDNQHLYAVAGDPNGSLDNGLYATTDGGQTWARNTAFFTSSRRVGRIALAISPTDPLRLYASIAQAGSIGGGSLLAMLRSDDGGASWTTLRAPNYLGGQGGYDTTLAVDPSDPDRVYAGGQGADSGAMQPLGVIESTDAGQTWTGIAVGASGKDGPHNDHHAVAFDASGRLLDGNDGGIWRLDNPDPGKIQWTDLNTNLQITTFIGVDVHPTDPTIAYGGSQDTGTEIYTGDPAWTETRAHDGGAIWVNRDNPNIVYHYTFANNATFERSDDGGQTWTTKTTGLSFGGNFFPPVVLDPSNSSRLVIGTTRVNETTDQGEHWTPISDPGMTGFAPIDSVAVAPSDPDTLYVSTSTNAGAHIYVTNDHGHTWMQRDVPDVLGHDHFFDLKVDPNDPQTAYAVRGIFGGGHVYQTTDGGQTWTDISGNLPDLPAFSLVIGPGIFFLGTDAGVYATVDGGKDWEPFGDGMPTFQVKQLVLNTNYNILAAGTHGRGMWEISLDDLNLRGRSAAHARRGAVEKPFPLSTLVALPGQPSLIEAGTVTLQADVPVSRLAEVDGFFVRPALVQGSGESGRPALRASTTVLDDLAIDAAMDLLPGRTAP
jgi:photosystem II stability/assembly factor-like uncharacterized protein